MDKKKSVLNVGVSLVSEIILLITTLYVRRLLIQYIGNDANGLNSLYISIIGMLSVAELGVGKAIVYSMYVPIIADNKKQVAALFCLYKKLYRIIGIIIFVAGLVLMPILPLLINDYENLQINVYVSFFLTLVSVLLSYLYSAKSSLIEAYKDNYITTSILTLSRVVKSLLQVIVILVWKSYIAFVSCQIIETLIMWALTDVAVYRKHGDIIVIHETVDNETKIEIRRNVKALFMHKIGTILVQSTDNIIISGYIGVLVLGYYSNYAIIAGVITAFIGLFFSPLTSVVGHLCASGDSKKTKEYFFHFYYLNYILGVVFFLGYYSVIHSVVKLCFGSNLEVSQIIVFIITINQFTAYLRKASLLFRDASGTFYNDRWKPVAEGITNLVLSLLFVNMIRSPKVGKSRLRQLNNACSLTTEYSL